MRIRRKTRLRKEREQNGVNDAGKKMKSTKGGVRQRQIAKSEDENELEDEDVDDNTEETLGTRHNTRSSGEIHVDWHGAPGDWTGASRSGAGGRKGWRRRGREEGVD